MTEGFFACISRIDIEPAAPAAAKKSRRRCGGGCKNAGGARKVNCERKKRVRSRGGGYVAEDGIRRLQGQRAASEAAEARRARQEADEEAVAGGQGAGGPAQPGPPPGTEVHRDHRHRA